MKKYSLALVFILGVTGCGSSNGVSKENTSGSIIQDDKKSPDDKTESKFTPSPYLQKTGANAEVLDDNATNWKAAEIKENGLMFERKSLVGALQEYTHEDGVKYCEDLNLAGYQDWRLPTKEELKLVLTLATNSTHEIQYFPDYFGSTKVGQNFPATWTSSPYGTGFYVGYVTPGYNYNEKYSSYSTKAWCVR